MNTTKKYTTTNHATGEQTAIWYEDIGGGWTLEFSSHGGKTHGRIYRAHYAGIRLVEGSTLAEIRENAQKGASL